MHRQLVLPEHLNAIHADVAHARHRILGDHAAERDVRTAILGPTDRYRELREVDISALNDGVLTGSAASHGAWRKLRHLSQPRQHRQFAEQPFGDLERDELADARAHVIEAVDAERERHAALRTEEIDRDRVPRPPAARQRRLGKQQCRSAARGLHATVRDFGDLFVDRNGLFDAHEIARVVDRADEGSEVIECHSGRRRSRPSGARTRHA